MDRQLGTLAALPEDLGSVPSIHTAAHNWDYCPRGSKDLFWLLQKSNNSTGVSVPIYSLWKFESCRMKKPSWAAWMRGNRIIFCYIDKEFHLLSSWEAILEVLCSSWSPSWLYPERPCDPGGLKTWCFAVLKFYMRHTTTCRTSFQEKINNNNKALLCR